MLPWASADEFGGAALIAAPFLLFVLRALRGNRIASHRITPPDNSHAPRRARRFAPANFPSSPNTTDVEQQLHHVMNASFKRERALSPSEYNVFKIVEDETRSMRQGHRVFAQTSLGEILSSPNVYAYRSINSKRVDILVIDRSGWPVAAVEYQGPGHYQGTAAARDAVKKEALRKAGVAYIEISDSDGSEMIRARLRQALAPDSLSPSSKMVEAEPQSPAGRASFGRRGVG